MSHTRQLMVQTHACPIIVHVRYHVVPCIRCAACMGSHACACACAYVMHHTLNSRGASAGFVSAVPTIPSDTGTKCWKAASGEVMVPVLSCV